MKYKDRLRDREILPKYRELKEMKDNLFNVRLNLAKLNQSSPWLEADVLKASKCLKSNKAADSSGLIFELFKPECVGPDRIKSLTKMANMMKKQCELPSFVGKKT